MTELKSTPSRQRWSRDQRHSQLLDVARRIIREEGTDALSLGRLAQDAGVTKPVAYSHFATRQALLAELFRVFETDQNARIAAALLNSSPELPVRAEVIANAYIDCVVAQGRELPGLVAALVSTPELDKIRSESEATFLERVNAALSPFVKSERLSNAAMRGFLGAAEALSNAAVRGDLTADEALTELQAVILNIVHRHKN